MPKEVKKYTLDELNDPEKFPELNDATQDVEDDEDDDEMPDDFYEDEDDEEPEDEVPGDLVPVDADKILDFSEILDVDDSGEEKFYIPEWGGNIVIRGITKTEINFIRKRARSKQNKGHSSQIVEEGILRAGIVQPRIDAQRYQLLQEKSAGVMLRIHKKIMEKSGLGDEAEKRREQRFPRK